MEGLFITAKKSAKIPMVSTLDALGVEEEVVVDSCLGFVKE
jgi:hypothetical protein